MGKKLYDTLLNYVIITKTLVTSFLLKPLHINVFENVKIIIVSVEKRPLLDIGLPQVLCFLQNSGKNDIE